MFNNVGHVIFIYYRIFTRPYQHLPGEKERMEVDICKPLI